jgi:hypothetical protein
MHERVLKCSDRPPATIYTDLFYLGTPGRDIRRCRYVAEQSSGLYGVRTRRGIILIGWGDFWAESQEAEHLLKKWKFEMWRWWLIGRIWKMAQFAGVDVVITAADRDVLNFKSWTKLREITQNSQWCDSIKAFKKLWFRATLDKIGVTDQY